MGFSTAVPIAVQQQLADAGGILNSRAAAITEQLESLAGYLNGLPEIWSGSASTYYQGLQQEWNIAAKGLFDPDVGVLGQIAAAMNVVWTNYSDGEWANTQTWAH
jgi:uncharacterized protein YukE